MELEIFEQIAAVLVVFVVAGGLAVLLRQPLMVGMLVAGIAVGPAALGLVEPSRTIELLASFGISLLLFVVGLRLDVRLLRRLGPVAVATGLGQVVFTAVIGFAIALLLGFDPVTGLYLAIALTFSSTIVIVKLLADKRELNHLHGRIAVGFLIVQDLVAILVMFAITAAGDRELEAGAFQRGVAVGLRGVALLAIALVVGRFVAPRLTALFTSQSELLVLATVSWAVLLGAVSLTLGFTEEVGAFLAGIALASTPYRDAVASRLGTLRDFLLVFFFIELGTLISLTDAADQLGAVITFSVFVLVGNPIIVMIIMGAFGYRRRVSYRAGLTVAQISEFSLILVALGVQQGHLDSDVVGLVAFVGLLTIAVSTGLINGSDAMFSRLSGPLRIFERQRPRVGLERADARLRPEYVVVGVGRLGSTLLQDLLDRGDAALGVDFDPRGIKRERWTLPVIHGDADDPHLPARLPLGRTRWVISTVPDHSTNRHLIRALREHGYTGSIAVAANDTDACRDLQEAGADITIRPLHLAATPLIRAIHEHDPGQPGGSGQGETTT